MPSPEFQKIVPSIVVGVALFVLLTLFFGGPGHKVLAWLAGLGTIALVVWWLRKKIEFSDLERQAQESKGECTDEYRIKWLRMHKDEILQDRWRIREEWRKNSTGLRGLLHRAFLSQEVMEYLREDLTRLEIAEELYLQSGEESEEGEEEELLPEVEIDFGRLITLVLQGKDRMLMSRYRGENPEAIRDQFIRQRPGKSKKMSEKLKLAVEYLGNLVEYEKTKNTYHNVDVDHTLNTATKVASLSDLDVKLQENRLKKKRIKKALERLDKEEPGEREEFDYNL